MMEFFPDAIPIGWLVPGAYSKFEFGVDLSGEYNGVLKCLCVASTSDASPLPVGVPTRIRNADDADALIGSRELLAHGVRTALEQQGVPVYAMRVQEPDAAVAASLVIEVTGPATASGRLGLVLNNTRWYVTITNAMTATQVATKIRDSVLARTRLPATSTSSAGNCTLTIVTKGTSGNHWVLGLILDELPTGISIAVTGGTALDNDRYRFGGGSGVEDLTSTFDVLMSGTTPNNYYERSAWGVTDTDNAVLIRDFVWDMAEPLLKRPQSATMGHNGTFASASGLPVATNDAAMRVVWKQNGMEHPFQLACAGAAMQAFEETQNPNTLYDEKIVPGIKPFYVKADRPSEDTVNAALEIGLTPITSDDDINARIVMFVTTWATKDGLPFGGCRDLGKWAVPVFCERDLRALWGQFREQNPRIRDNWSTGENPVQGVGTPRMWASSVNGRLQDYEKAGYIIVGNRFAETFWLTEQKAFGAYIHLYVTDLHHQTGMVIRQVYRT